MSDARLIDPFIADQDLQRILGRSSRSLRRYRAKSILPHRKIGGVMGCFESDLRRAFGLREAPNADDEKVDATQSSSDADTTSTLGKSRK